MTDDPWHWVETTGLGGRPTALVETDDGYLAAVGGALWHSPDGLSWLEDDTEGLPDGDITALGWIHDDPPVTLAFVHGHGLFRNAGDGWEPPSVPPDSPLLTALNPRAIPVPMNFAADANRPGTAWMAAVGGLFHTTDGGRTWASVPALADAGFNLLFTGVAARGDDIAATAFRPAGVLPGAYADLFTAGIFRSTDGGETWFQGDPAQLTRYPTDVAFDPNGNAWVSTQDAGLLHETGTGWITLGGPADQLALEWTRGGVNLATGRQGVWRYQATGWTQAGSGPIAAIAGDHALTDDGGHWALTAGPGSVADPRGGATVHVALSMHVNLYHSYRGDTPDDDGYGLDLDVMRTTLSWLETHPEVHADWDMDNAWSTDDWLQTDGSDVLAAIQARVADGRDDVRLMSWNNGAMPAHTREEFDESIRRAWASNLALFDEVVPGVQPQECMFTPEHVDWYVDQGIEWITLFNSATPFTALRNEITLPSSVWNNPVIIATDSAAMTLVPVYHHGDLLNHGGLVGWVTALHEAAVDDQLLVIHFDADAESWERFDLELDAVADLEFVRFTTIQDYLDSHPAAVTIPAPLDMADGTGDGMQSWAEKQFNQEIATGIAQARTLAEQAAALAGDDEEVVELLDEAMEPRLLSLSTTHFGLAAPTLHPDRVDRAREYVADAIAAATAAWNVADSRRPVAPGTIEITETRGAAGPALVEATVAVPAASWTDPATVVIRDPQGDVVPAAVTAVTDGDPVLVDLAWVATVEPRSTTTLTWSVESAEAAAAPGVDPAPLHDDLGLVAPFTECGGVTGTARSLGQSPVTVDPLGVMATQEDHWALPVCTDEGSVTWTRRVFAGLPGVVVEVEATLPALSDSDADRFESVALSPIACDGDADLLTWRTMGGATPTRAVRQGVPTWNGQVVDGWVILQCADGRVHAVSHRVTERTSLGFAPVRTTGEDALLAPLGTLWGPAPLHEARRTGGHGMGDVVTEIVGSQFRPAAPDWAGRSIRFRLWGSADDGDPPEEGTLDLFAHPPLVRVGEFAE
ncbi:MAG: hypothetical protein D6798_19900 [Deltaproteobacteria bacterium]|nr:MAG: hypothetical protein D6798_19900 [Deltaproteobacteria bacterium]